MEKATEKPPAFLPGVPAYQADEANAGDPVINASGHVQEVDRNFTLISACSIGLTCGNTWPALGGSIVVSLYNGGPPGVIYELLAVSAFYWIIATCIAELASSIPSSAGVYHWATVTAGPTYGKVVGWYAGWLNCFAWIFGSTSLSNVAATLAVSMYSVFNPGYVLVRGHVFIAYLIITWVSCLCVMYANRALPRVNQFGLFLILAGVFITILVCAIMPSTSGTGHASDAFVWKDWRNLTGYSSSGFAFLLGMLNGAYAVGTPDCITHLAEEIPNPRVNIPKALAAQMVIGLLTAFCYLAALFYSINDLDAVFVNPYTSPIAEIYRQATGTRGGAFGLLLIIFLPLLPGCVGTYITAGRMLWTLARDDATPFSKYLGRIHPRKHNPFNATLMCGIINTVLGLIYIGSLTAFSAFVGSFVILTTLSYLMAILPNLVTRRAYLVPGPFRLPPIVAYSFYSISSAYIIVFVVIFCFPYSMPFSAQTMNYSCVITGGLSIFVSMWYIYKRKNGYVGAHVLTPRDMAVADAERISGDKI
ncbi:amino acid transporter [Pseudovirgaria hyperparasitica]|uniref:Amino acid transporter n=1 Tax=Pseudovirgaria hyperparasitica TaxID=470096 RepID=A0A6A6VV55_9PEZI|nr:amino acid transporter [Pseudovirgaria hyperparasitica]KAF2753131.1 amino acid transporter [Pseudovirgaria hyperparasitica]